MTQPLHVTGPYRSGTTYAALLIGNHPAYPAPGLHTTNWPRERHGPLGAGTRHALAYAEKRWGLEPIRKTERRGVHGQDPEALAWDRTMEALGYERDGRWMEKTNLALSFTDTFLDWFPRGKVLAVLRDPRSVLASFREYTYTPPPTYLQAAFVCLHAMQHVHRHGAKRPLENPGAPYAYVTYERLATHPEETLRGICTWLGLAWPGRDVMLATDDWEHVPGVAWEDRSSFADPSEIDVQKAVQRWKGNLTGAEHAFVEWVCWDHMGAFGWEPTNSVRPYPLQFPELIGSIYRHEGTRRMLDRWLDTGEGTETFPADPEDASTWRESNREVTA